MTAFVVTETRRCGHATHSGSCGSCQQEALAQQQIQLRQAKLARLQWETSPQALRHAAFVAQRGSWRTALPTL